MSRRTANGSCGRRANTPAASASSPASDIVAGAVGHRARSARCAALRTDRVDIALIGQFVLNGLMLGVMYGLVAVGFTLFFGVLDVIKFSHGDVLTVGAFTAFTTYLALKAASIAT